MRISKGLAFAALVAILLGLLTEALADDQVAGTAQSLGVSAAIEPFMAVSVFTVESRRIPDDRGFLGLGDTYLENDSRFRGTIEFEALEKPGIIEPDKHIQIIVSSNCASWSVDCGSDGLFSADDQVPPERLYIRSYYTDPGVDEGAGPGYENLVEPKLVAAGSASKELSYEVFLRLEVTWEDSPGDYDGLLRFTVLRTP